MIASAASSSRLSLLMYWRPWPAATLSGCLKNHRSWSVTREGARLGTLSGPGEWTSVRIEVKGTAARLFVGDASQPVLVVNDLRRGEVGGGIGLWLHSSTLAHYRDLRVSAGG